MNTDTLLFVSPTDQTKIVFWEAFGILDIMVDLATTALPIYMLYDLRIQKSKRIAAILAFMTRLMYFPLLSHMLF